MTVLHKPFLFLSLLFVISGGSAQTLTERKYPQGYFKYPLHTTPSLAANFGELRPNHYHMGLDCKTEHHENLPVFAAAEGYIAKVKIEPAGFGRAIYINHPNGLTTLYAHLNRFTPELEAYVKQQQYKQQSWKIFIDIPSQLFPVKQDQFIALSGNTGGSQGPHVHFEIRDTRTDKVLNPLLFGLPIRDNIPPVVSRLAIYDRCVSTYEQQPRTMAVIKRGSSYTTALPVIVVNTDKVSFGISASDRVVGAANAIGIYQASLSDNGKLVTGFTLDSITYEETRYLNAHIDYKTKASGGPYIQHLSRLPGYPQGVYHDISGDGVIRLDDDSLHHILITIKDAYGNQSNLAFSVRRSGSDTKHQRPSSPDEFRPNQVNIFSRNDIEVITTERSVYDSFPFQYGASPATSVNALSAIHRVHSGIVPVHDSITIKLKANGPVSDGEHIVIRRWWGDKDEVARPVRSGGWFEAKFRSFGDFQLLRDEQPPVIIPLGIRDGSNLSRASQIAFLVRDNNDEIRSFRAELDGQWLCFTNDKNKAFIYHFDEHCSRGRHTLVITAEDEAGNRSTKSYTFTR